jgi:hypothetical protein
MSRSTVDVLAPPSATCTGNVLMVSEAGLHIEELPRTQADGRGLIFWRWRSLPDHRRAQRTVTVTCVPGGTTTVTVPPDPATGRSP